MTPDDIASLLREGPTPRVAALNKRICAELSDRSKSPSQLLEASLIHVREILDLCVDLEREAAVLRMALEEFVLASDDVVHSDDDIAAVLRFGDADKYARAVLATIAEKETKHG